MKSQISLFILLSSITSLVLGDPITRIIDVQTTIDPSQLISYEVTSFVIMPNSLNLTYVEDKHSFRDVNVSVSISTDAPVAKDFIQLQFKTSILRSTCYDQDEMSLPTPPDFVNLYVSDVNDDSQKLSLNTFFDIPSSDNGGEFITSDFDLWFRFGTIPTRATSCNGEVTFNVGIAI